MNRHFFSTSHLTGGARADYWASLVCDTFVELDCNVPLSDHFNGQISSFQDDEFQLFTLASSPHEVSRTSSRIAKSTQQDFLLTLQTSGSGVALQGGRAAMMAQGDFAIVDTTRPYDLRFTGDFSQIVMRLPREIMLSKLVNIEDLTARLISGSHGVGKLASTFLQQLPVTLDSIDPRYLSSIQNTAMALITTAAAERLDTPQHSSDHHMVLRRRISTYIDSHLTDADLSCESIAGALGISARHLSKLFEKNELHVSQIIRLRRLEFARVNLIDPLQSHLSITTIAYNAGFKSSSHFSRLFKSAYEVAPYEYRLNVFAQA